MGKDTRNAGDVVLICNAGGGNPLALAHGVSPHYRFSHSWSKQECLKIIQPSLVKKRNHGI